MKDLDHLIELINSYPTDIKAEILVADLMEEGFTDSDFLISFSSAFKRSYSKDIIKTVKTRNNSYREILEIYLARDGLYDLLPEGLFHVAPDAAVASGKGMASDSKKETRIEEETRKFFQPFENEFFYQRVQLELQERSILQRLNENTLEDFFLNFWKIDQSLPKELIIKLSAMLPFSKEIVGDFEMTASCLAAILDEKVTYTVAYTSEPGVDNIESTDDKNFSLGEARLGVNLVTGGEYIENCKTIRFLIGPLKKTYLTPYLKNGNIARFIECFCNYFVPMEMIIEYEVVMPEELHRFVLGSDKEQAMLGYSTVI
jgi:hypothetical protein